MYLCKNQKMVDWTIELFYRSNPLKISFFYPSLSKVLLGILGKIKIKIKIKKLPYPNHNLKCDVSLYVYFGNNSIFEIFFEKMVLKILKTTFL